jgi:hypothetical protein
MLWERQTMPFIADELRKAEERRRQRQDEPGAEQQKSQASRNAGIFRYCPHCDAMVDDQATSCPHCGAALLEETVNLPAPASARLTESDRARIYEEEKVRLEARRNIKVKEKGKALLFLIVIAFGFWIYRQLPGKAQQPTKVQLTPEQLLRQKVEQAKREAVQPASLAYRVIEKHDTSYANTPRMTYRIVCDVDKLPESERMKATAEQVWRSGNQQWKQFTVFMYLSDMDTHDAAYAVGEFTPNGLQDFRVQDYSLYGTKWRSLEDEAKKAEAQWREQKKNPGVKDYRVDLDVVKVDARRLKINARTNFPDRANLFVNVIRIYYQQGKQEAYSGEIFSKDMPVTSGKIELLVNIDDLVWYNKFQQRKKQFGGLGIVSDIERIAQQVEVRVMFSPRRDQSQEVLNIVGRNGEYIKGAGAKRLGDLTTYDVSRSVAIPFEQ